MSWGKVLYIYIYIYSPHHRIVSVVKRVEFVSDGMSYVVLRGCWCNIIVYAYIK